MDFIKAFYTGMFIAGLVLAIIVGFTNLPEEQLTTISQDQSVTLASKAQWFFLMQIGYKSITPAWQKDWIPIGFKDSPYIPILEDMPTPDEIDFFPLLFFLFVPMYLITNYWNPSDLKGHLLKWTVFILLIPLGFALTKIFYFFMYYLSGYQLGITHETLNNIRNQGLSATKDIMTGLMILMLPLLASFIAKFKKMLEK